MRKQVDEWTPDEVVYWVQHEFDFDLSSMEDIQRSYSSTCGYLLTLSPPSPRPLPILDSILRYYKRAVEPFGPQGMTGKARVHSYGRAISVLKVRRVKKSTTRER